jgi:hypothetical protein
LSPGLFRFLHVSIFDGGDELRQLIFILGSNLGDSEYGCSLGSLSEHNVAIGPEEHCSPSCVQQYRAWLCP